MICRIVNYILDRLYISRGGIHKNDRYGGLHKAFGYVYHNHLQGDYVEFGVYKGDGLINAIKCVNEFDSWLQTQKLSNEQFRRDMANQSCLNQLMDFHALDTFEGMPENNESSTVFKTGNFLSSLETVKKKVKKYIIKDININYYKGLFIDNTAEFKNKIGTKNIIIANIDCDLMESTVDALNIIKNNINIGTVLLFDDYNAFNADNNHGQRKAFKEFELSSKYIFEKFSTYGYAGQMFLIVGLKS